MFLSLYVFAYSAPALGAQVTYCSHIANVGWLSWVSDGQTSGSPGSGNQMEAVQIKTVGFPSTYHIDYQAHVSYIGWQGWVSDGQTAGTTGQGKAIEAIQIKLRGFPSNYHVKYRAYVQNIGWQGWVEDGTTAGTEHGRKTAAQNDSARKWRKRNKNPTYKEAREDNVEAMKKAKPELVNNKEAVECIKIAIKEYFEDELGLSDSDTVRTPRGGKFKLPSGGTGVSI